MGSRSAATIVFPRSASTTTTHIPSGQPWWQMGARYHLQALYPENPEIWNTKRDNKTNTLRERDEDINSRPLFARHIGANTLIHLHTNGSIDTADTGTQVYYHTGRAADELLGNSILCYMKELIQANEPYENYTVPSQSIGAVNNGENTLATMSSVIVEVGFHSNPNDALALQDPEFRTAAMKGVEKGYRLNAEGNTNCEPFGITSIPNATGPQNMPIQHIVNYEGHPQFPVKAKMEFVSCQSGWTCNDFEVTFANDVPSPLIYNTTCTVSTPRPPATFRIRTTLIDADGVSAEPVEHSYTCTTP